MCKFAVFFGKQNLHMTSLFWVLQHNTILFWFAPIQLFSSFSNYSGSCFQSKRCDKLLFFLFSAFCQRPKGQEEKTVWNDFYWLAKLRIVVYMLLKAKCYWVFLRTLRSSLCKHTYILSYQIENRQKNNKIRIILTYELFLNCRIPPWYTH